MKLQTGTTDYCDNWRIQIHRDIKARIQKQAEYKIQAADSNECCVQMDLGRGVCKAFQVLALAIPSINQSINCGKLWRTAVGAAYHVMVVGSDWVCDKRVN